MSAFILLSACDKSGVCYPTIFEFPDEAALDAWLESGGDEALESWEEFAAEMSEIGGYAAAHVLRPGVGGDPAEFLADHLERIADNEDGDLTAP